jgi:hypothetical protein
LLFLLFHASLLLGLFFEPEDGGEVQKFSGFMALVVQAVTFWILASHGLIGGYKCFRGTS